MDNNQHVGGRMRTFDEQDAIMQDFPQEAVNRLSQTIADRGLRWDDKTVRTTIYGYMRFHRCNCTEAVDGLIRVLEKNE